MLLAAPAASAQNNYQFTAGGIFKYTFISDPSHILGDCSNPPQSPPTALTCLNIENIIGTVSITPPAAASGMSLPDSASHIQLDAATFQVATTGLSSLTAVQISDYDPATMQSDPGVTSCTGVAAGFNCNTNGLTAVNSVVTLHMRFQITYTFSTGPVTLGLGISFAWGLTPLAPQNIITGVRVVQVTQEPTNPVVLIPGKQTAVQVFFKDDLPADSIVTLKNLDHGDFPPLQLGVDSIEASQMGKALNFHLPSSWFPDQILSFSVEVKSGTVVLQHTTAAATIEDPPLWPKPYEVLYLTLCEGNLCAGAPSSPVPLEDADALMAQLFPIRDGGLRYYGLPGTWQLPFLGATPQEKADTLLARLRFLDLALLELLGPAAPDQLVAWYPAGSTFGAGNPVGFYDNYLLYVYGLGRIAVLSDRPSDRAVAMRLASGLAHNLVQLHADLRTPSAVGFGGFDTSLNTEVGASHPDLLKGGTIIDAVNAWLSPDSFKKIYTAYKDAADFRNGSSSASPKPGARRAASAEYLTISGTARRDGSGGHLNAGFRSTPPFAGPDSDPNGNHCLRFSGDSGPLGDYCFTIGFVDPITGGDLDQDIFVVSAPWPAGTKQVALVRDGSELASLTLSANAPSLQITSPQQGDQLSAGPLHLQWTASDPDGNTLVYQLFYSTDGGSTWMPLDPQITDTSYTVDGTRLPGSSVMFQLLASNGLNTTTATVGPVTVMQTPQIALPQTDVDFRKAVVNIGRQQTLVVSNSGSGPLTVMAIAADNGVFTATSPGLPFVIPAGGQRSVGLRFSPSSAGPASGSLSIASSDPNQPTIRATVHGIGILKMDPDVAVSPKTLDFGSLNVGQTKDLTLTVQNYGPGVLHISSMRSSNAAFQVTTGSLPAIAAGDSQTVTIRFAPSGAGSQTGTVTLATDDPLNPSVSVSLIGAIGATSPSGGSLAVSPTTLDFGSVNTGQGKDLTLAVNNNGSTSQNVIATTSNPLFSVSPSTSFAVGANSSASVTVHFAPTSAGLQSATVTVATTDGMQSIPVTVSGTGAASASPSGNITRTLGYHEITRFPKEVRFSNGGMPALSAGGGRAVYAHAPGDETDARYNHIFVVNADGTGQREVDVYKQNCFCGAIVDISTDGNTVVSTDGVELRAASATGSAGKRLITNREIPYVRISPRGDKVFFIHRRGDASATDATTERGLYVVNIDGTGLKQVAGPKAVAALLGITADKVFPFATNGWSLDVSADGAKLVFGIAAPGGERIFTVNADGSGLKQALGPVDFVNHAALSGDGTKVGYDVTAPPCCSSPNEVGVVNADGSSRKALATKTPDIGSANRIEMSGDGTQLLYGNTSYLYATDGSGIVQLSARGGYFSSDSAPLVTDGFGQPTMNSLANRFLYIVRDSAGIPQLATLDINPSALGDAPSITASMLSQPSIALNGANQSLVSAMVTTSNTINRISATVLSGGITDPNVNGPVMVDDGTNGDQTAGDGIYTGKISANCCATLGAKSVRVKAEVRDSGNRRHATAVEFGGLTVSSTP
jgi:hypothetical protein